MTIRFIVRRLFWAIFMFFAATMVTYLIFYVVPRDPAKLVAGAAGGSQEEHIRQLLHLDVPLYQQYWIFLWNIVRHGSLGYSYFDGASVQQILRQDVPITGSLVLGGAVFWLLLSFPIGIVSALRPRSVFDRVGMVFVLIGVAAPTVWIGLILAYVVGYKLGWTPISGYCDFFPSHDSTCSGPREWAYHLILPWVTFMLVFAALYARMIRANVLETLTEDHVRTARAKGASGAHLLVHHVLRTSLLPVVTMLGMDLVTLSIGGAVFTETVFNLHGVGSEMVVAARQGNLPVIMGIVIAVTVLVIVVNFLVDVVYAFLDPRVRLKT